MVESLHNRPKRGRGLGIRGLRKIVGNSAIPLTLILSEQAQKMRIELSAIHIETSGRGKYLCICRPKQPFRPLRAVSRNIDEVCFLAPSDVFIKPVYIFIAALKPTGSPQLGRNNAAGKILLIQFSPANRTPVHSENQSR